jgi:peptidyl-prolyl cis-trans isomerase D
MFDLFRSREKATRYLLGGLLFAVAASMVITLIPGFGSNTGTTGTDPTVLAEIGNEKLTGQEAQQMFQQITASQQINSDMLAAYFPQFVEQMIVQRAALFEAERMGLGVTDEEVLVGVQSQIPQAFQNGGVDKAQIEQYYAAQGQTLNDGLDAMRKQLIVRRLENSTLQGVVVSPAEVEAEYRKKYERAKVQYIAFPSTKFVDQIKPTEADLKAYFEVNHAKYSMAEKFNYQVLVLDQDKIEAALQISDAQLRQAYAASLDNFRMPERVHARHILIKADSKASDAEKKAALAKAEDILKQLKGGADFADLAKKNSDDPGSKDKGGDLDFLVSGQTVPEFDKMAFSLPINQLSPVVTTQFGYHIIQVLEKQPAHVKPFEEVKTGLLAELRKQTVTDKMQNSGDQMREALAKDPGAASAIAKQFGADLVEVPNAGASDPIPGLGVSPEVGQTLAGLQNNGVSQVLTLPGNRLVVIVLNHKTPPRPALPDEVKDQVRSAYITEQAQKVAHDKAMEAAERMKKGEDPEAVAKSMKLEAVTSTEFSRNDSVEGLGPAVYVEEAFSKPAGTVLGPTMIQSKDVVYKILTRAEANMAAFPAEREQILFAIKQKKAKDRYDLLMDSILTKLTDEGKVKVHRDAIQKLVSSYRR